MSGLDKGSFCATQNYLESRFKGIMARHCSTSASGHVKIPPYGQGFPSIYQTGAISAMEIKNTRECNFLMRKCEELSKRVKFSTQDRSKLHDNILSNFLIPFSSLKLDGVPAAKACSSSSLTPLAQKIEEYRQDLLDADIKGAVASISAQALGIALKSNPAISRIYERGGEDFFKLILRSLIQARYFVYL